MFGEVSLNKASTQVFNQFSDYSKTSVTSQSGSYSVLAAAMKYLPVLGMKELALVGNSIPALTYFPRMHQKARILMAYISRFFRRILYTEKFMKIITIFYRFWRKMFSVLCAYDRFIAYLSIFSHKDIFYLIFYQPNGL